jgi:DNA-binding NarL/FixJ family response regulator
MGGNVVIASRAKSLAADLWAGFIPQRRELAMAGCDGELFELTKRLRPCLVLVENCFTGITTDEVIGRLAKRFRGINVAVWNLGPCNAEAAARFIFAGARSFIDLRALNREETGKVLNRVVAGHAFYPEKVGMIIDREDLMPEINPRLTGRELEVIKLSALGNTNGQIARKLGCSLYTVKVHKANIQNKTGLKGQGAFCLFSISKGYINLEEESLGLGRRNT